MRTWAALAMTAWYFVVFSPNSGLPAKVEFKDFDSCHYFKTYAQIKTGEGGLTDGGTSFPPGYIPNVAGCFWETDGPSQPHVVPTPSAQPDAEK